jgi:hypothetical protein
MLISAIVFILINIFYKNTITITGVDLGINFKGKDLAKLSKSVVHITSPPFPQSEMNGRACSGYLFTMVD